MAKNIVDEMGEFFLSAGGIGHWITEDTDEFVLSELRLLSEEKDKNISHSQLCQLLIRGHQATPSRGFFEYYWLTYPAGHPYKTPPAETTWFDSGNICGLDHLKWGLRRLYADGLMWWGNVREAYRELRSLSFDELECTFSAKRFETDRMSTRGATYPLRPIPKDSRYLIAEMACKSFGDGTINESDLYGALLKSYKEHLKDGGAEISFRELLQHAEKSDKYHGREPEFEFSANELLDEGIQSREELIAKFDGVWEKFSDARLCALENTRNYLSMVNDLDVYVATSMRTRSHFRAMADRTERIFGGDSLDHLNLRFFDPTLSATGSHEDKGLVECLMVKCAKALVYCAGDRDSYGKDAEAAMALSLGKPVIFLCDAGQKANLLKDVHPLSRLIEFSSGIAVGAIVTENENEVVELLRRIFSNEMEYELAQKSDGYLLLKEKLTGSTVRLQTSDRLLAETFWNHYHQGDGAGV